MYLYVIIYWAITSVFATLLEMIAPPPWVMISVGLWIRYVCGCLGNSLYRRHVERKIKQIKTTVPPEYWAQAFKDMGGTNVWAVIALIFINLLIIYWMYLTIFKEGR
jgi:hypothetical protein